MIGTHGLDNLSGRNSNSERVLNFVFARQDREYRITIMEREQAIEQIQQSAKQIALQLMQIHPVVPSLEEETIQSKVLHSLHQITVELEIVKKQLIMLQKRDDSTEL